jgi:hypothetical protein
MPHRRQREPAVGKRLRNARAALAALERDADDQRPHRADARDVAANLNRGGARREIHEHIHTHATMEHSINEIGTHTQTQV